MTVRGDNFPRELTNPETLPSVVARMLPPCRTLHEGSSRTVFACLSCKMDAKVRRLVVCGVSGVSEGGLGHRKKVQGIQDSGGGLRSAEASSPCRCSDTRHPSRRATVLVQVEQPDLQMPMKGSHEISEEDPVEPLAPWFFGSFGASSKHTLSPSCPLHRPNPFVERLSRAGC